MARILDVLSDRIHELVAHLYGAPETLYIQMDKSIESIEGGLRVLQTIFREQEKDYIKVISAKDTDVTASITPLHV